MIEVYRQVINRCLDPTCYLYHKPALSTRYQFLHNHVIKKTNKQLFNILTDLGLVVYPECLSRFTLLNIYADFCKEPIASKILGGVK